MDELERTKLEVLSLKQKLSVLRQAHEVALLELAEAREGQARYRKLNDALVEGIQANKTVLAPMPGITLNIEGEFGCSRCLDLEKELDSYRTGVNCSVERRVKEITKTFAQMQEEDRRKSRAVGASRITNHFHSKDCHRCPQLEQQITLHQKALEEALADCEERLADRDILTAKMGKMQALIATLQEENTFLEEELARWKEREEYQNAYERPTRASMVRADQKSSRMMQEITSIVNCLSSKKTEDKRKSRPYPNDPSLFSIKNGINRPNGYF